MIKDLFSQKQTLSFEVFPPKKDDEFTNAQNVLHQLSELQPDFISVTYGAGGSRSKRTVELASFIQNSLHIPAVAHMTWVWHTSTKHRCRSSSRSIWCCSAESPQRKQWQI